MSSSLTSVTSSGGSTTSPASRQFRARSVVAHFAARCPRARHGGSGPTGFTGFSATHLAGPFAVSLTVKPESRDAAVAATLEEIQRFRQDGMTPKELADERSSHVGRFKVDLASNGGIAHAIDAAVYYGLGVSYLDLFPSLVEAVTKEQADAAFAKRVNPDLFTIVSAGSFE